MSETFDLELPDGRIIQGIPAGTSKAEIARKLGLPMPEAKAAPNPLIEGLKTAGSALYGGVTSIPRFVMDAGDALERLIPTPEWSKTPIPGGKVIGEADTAIRQALRPETEAGRTAARVGEAVVGAVAGPGGLARPLASAGIGLGAGVGAEIGGKLTAENPLARAAGGILGGGATALGQALRPNAETMVRQATLGVTPEHFRQAAQTQRTLNEAGLPNLASQHLGPNSSLADLVELASMNPRVRPSLLKAAPAGEPGGTAGIIPKTEEVLNAWMAQNLPVAAAERRGLMQDIQNVAKVKDAAAVAKSNAAYAAAMPAKGAYSADTLEALKASIKDLAQGSRYGQGTVGGDLLSRWADTHLTLPPGQSMPATTLNNMIKDLNVQAVQEGWKGLPTGDLKAILKQATPEFEAARQAKTAVMQGEVTPMRQGLAGKIAQLGGGPDAAKYTAGDFAKLVFPSDKAQPQAIAKLADDIGPDQVGQLLREHLTSAWQGVSKAQVGKEGVPADFVAATLGNTAMQANIKAGLNAAAKDLGLDPSALNRGFAELTHALGTYRDLKLGGGIDKASASFQAGKSALGTAAAPQSRLGRFAWETASAKTYQQIADMVTSPEGLKLIERIARTPDPKRKAALIRGVIAGAEVDGGNTPDVTTE